MNITNVNGLILNILTFLFVGNLFYTTFVVLFFVFYCIFSSKEILNRMLLSFLSSFSIQFIMFSYVELHNFLRYEYGNQDVYSLFLFMTFLIVTAFLLIMAFGDE